MTIKHKNNFANIHKEHMHITLLHVEEAVLAVWSNNLGIHPTDSRHSLTTHVNRLLF